MKVVRTYISGTEAQIRSGRLTADGITNQVQGGRAYTSVVLGGSDGRWQILVNDEDFERAEEILKDSPIFVVEEASVNPRPHLKKAVMFAVFAILFAPIVFHIFSIQQAITYWKLESDLKAKTVWVFILCLLYMASLPLLWFIISGYGQALKMNL